MRTFRLAIVPGDGIGVDVTREAVKILDAVAPGRADFRKTFFPWSADHYLATGESLPKGAFDDLSAHYDAIFMGAFGDPRIPDMAHARDILLGARFVLDLYVNYRPVRCLAERLNPLKTVPAAAIDFVIFRENTEGSYAGTGGNFKKGTPDEVALQEDISTRKGVERIVRHAFEFARDRGKTKVCMSDKSNAMRFVGDLWRAPSEVAAGSPASRRRLYVDALVMQTVKYPTEFEVVVTNNMFGDITTDLGASLQGGLGMAASANIHPGRVSMFEPVHGSAPKYAGTGRANPFGAILTAALMLEHLGLAEAARAVEGVVVACLEARECTPDVGGGLTPSRRATRWRSGSR
jgi:3-isopropylmalate dehydrogenase